MDRFTMANAPTSGLGAFRAFRRGRLSLLTGAIVLLFGASAQAMPPELGESVRNIQGANDISGWSHIDNQHVVMHVDEKKSYLLTLKHQCHGLAWAQNVTVTMSNNTIWAGFDAIQADGLACPIHSIHKVDPKSLLDGEP